jgi:hypothetical protein
MERHHGLCTTFPHTSLKYSFIPLIDTFLRTLICADASAPRQAYETKIAGSMTLTQTHLDKLHQEISKTLEKITAREKHMNKQLEGTINEFRVEHDKLAAKKEQYVSFWFEKWPFGAFVASHARFPPRVRLRRRCVCCWMQHSHMSIPDQLHTSTQSGTKVLPLTHI